MACDIGEAAAAATAISSKATLLGSAVCCAPPAAAASAELSARLAAGCTGLCAGSAALAVL